VLGGAEGDLKQAPWLAAFLPVILGMAGNVGTQTSAITVRGLALGRIDLHRVGKVIRRLVATGLALGLIFGCLLYGFTFLRVGNEASEPARAALAVAISIFCAMTVGATMGVVVPIVLHRLRFDPAIAASPFVQTANDLTGAGIYLLIIRWIGLLH